MVMKIEYANKADLEAQVKAAIAEYESARTARRAANQRLQAAACTIDELVEALKLESRSVLDDALAFQKRMSLD